MKGPSQVTLRLAFLALPAIIAVAVPPAQAGPLVFDAAADFSLASNPNGVWSYGYEESLGSKLQLYDEAHVNWEGVSGLNAWSSSSTTDRDPNVSHNRTNMDIIPSFAPTIDFPAGGLDFHPGRNGEFSVIRWTAPTAGMFDIEVAFRGDNFVFPTTTDVHVLLNGNSLFSGEVSAFGPGPSFSDIISVKSGDTVDFAVGFGPDGNFTGDSTGISATISLVPEPRSLTLLGIGIAGLVIYGVLRHDCMTRITRRLASSPCRPSSL